MKNLEELKIAIVCDSLDQYGGGEKLVDTFFEIFPNADVFTSFYNEEKIRTQGFKIPSEKIRTPKFGRNKYLLKFSKALFFIYPYIFESFDLSEYDLVLSSSARFSHGVITSASTIHICYMHTPSRFVWDYFEYVNDNRQINKLQKFLLPFFVTPFRMWDRVAADRVDYFITNSNYSKLRIKKFYRKNSFVIFPFVDVKRFKDIKTSQNYFLVLGRLTPRKKIEIVIQAFNKIGLSLRIVGNGDKKYIDYLKSISKGNIEFFEKQTDDEVVKHISMAKALIWMVVEDFGMVPLEVNAAGKPIIAYKKGGILDIVKEGENGIFFDEQTSDSLISAIEKFKGMSFDSEVCIKYSQKFKKETFEKQIKEYIIKILNENSISS